MRYVKARARQQARDLTYRIYVTDCLYCIADKGLRMTKRYSDLINEDKRSQAKKVDNRTVDEVVDHIWSKIGG